MDIAIVVVCSLNLILLIIIFLTRFNKNTDGGKLKKLENSLIELSNSFGKFDMLIKEEFSFNRDENRKFAPENCGESNKSARDGREESRNLFMALGKNLSQSIGKFSDTQREKSEDLTARLDGIRRDIDVQLKELRMETTKQRR